MVKKIFIITMVFWFGCTPNQPNKDELLSKNVDFLIVKGNDFWEKRVNPENAKWARNFLNKAHKLRPKDKKTGFVFKKNRAYHFDGCPFCEDELQKSIIIEKLMYEQEK